MRWRNPKSPIRAEEQEWIERSMHWLHAQLGSAALHGEVVVPVSEFFPEPYRGSRDDVVEVLRRVCQQMAVDPATVADVALIEVDEQGMPRQGTLSSGCDDAPTRYAGGAHGSVVAIPDYLPRRPVSLVAALAHQIGHVQLLREGRITAERADHEPLTDLVSVYFGLGIFAANAALDFQKQGSADPLTAAREVPGTLFGGGFRAYRHGYLTEPMFGYALAHYAWLRNESEPSWARYLHTNPRVYLKRGLRYLRARDTA